MRTLEKRYSDGNTDIVLKDFNRTNTTVGVKFSLNNGTNINSINCWLEFIDGTTVLVKAKAFLPCATDGVIDVSASATKSVIDGYVQAIFPVEATISALKFEFVKVDGGLPADGDFSAYTLNV